MAIDYGLKRVGVAITDASCTISQPLLTIKPKSESDLIKRLKYLAEENDVGVIILGNPLSLRGEPTEMSNRIEKFLKKLRRAVSAEVMLWDERYVSRYAASKMKSMGISSSKEDIDRVSAAIMLEEYLLSKRA